MAKTDDSQRLYRILDFTRAVQIFEKRELYFANPGSWDDPYEKRLKHSKNHAVFAQCWSSSPTSDAMWRIYSQNGMGVRISTTKAKLDQALSESTKLKKYQFRVAKVTYLSTFNLTKKINTIAYYLNEEFKISRAVDALYIKRLAFNHEKEWRATLFSKDSESSQEHAGFTVPVNPHEIIDNILLDPRAPEELVNAFKFYFQNKLSFKGSVRRSALYNAPRQIEIDEVTVDQL